MSRSFIVSLKQFTLGVAIGKDEKLLERKIDVLDVVSVLMDEGFSSFDKGYTYHRMYGHDYNSLRNLMLSKLVGVPRDAFIELLPIGKAKEHLQITLTY